MSTDIKQKQVEQPQKKEKEPGVVMSLVLSILKEIAEFKGWDLIWQSLMYGFLAWGIYNAKLVYEWHTNPQYAYIDKVSFFDFKYSLISAAVFQLFKMLVSAVFYKPLYNYLDPVKFPTHEDKHKRAKHASTWVTNCIYYTFSTIAGYILFKDSDFWPAIMGGVAQPIDVFKHFPHAQNFPWGTAFYMIQFGVHLHTVIEYIFVKWNDPKFWEMFLHHILAVQLIFFSYMINNNRVGIMVLFLHDPCDVFLCANRLISDAKNKSLAVQGSFFFFLMNSWFFLRIIVFPKYIVSPALEYIFSADTGIVFPIYLFLVLMLCVLVVMHIYWFIFLVRILIIMASGKKEYNIYDNKKKEAKKID